MANPIGTNMRAIVEGIMFLRHPTNVLLSVLPPPANGAWAALFQVPSTRQELHDAFYHCILDLTRPSIDISGETNGQEVWEVSQLNTSPSSKKGGKHSFRHLVMTADSSGTTNQLLQLLQKIDVFGEKTAISYSFISTYARSSKQPSHLINSYVPQAPLNALLVYKNNKRLNSFKSLPLAKAGRVRGVCDGDEKSKTEKDIITDWVYSTFKRTDFKKVSNPPPPSHKTCIPGIFLFLSHSHTHTNR